MCLCKKYYKHISYCSLTVTQKELIQLDTNIQLTTAAKEH